MRDIYTPAGGPPQGSPPDPKILEVMGEEGIRKLLSAHYKNLTETSLRDMFPKDMEAAAQKSADFFIQMLGGTPYYSQKKGSPRMRQRHIPFEITDAARLIWLDCFFQAMDEVEFPDRYRENFEDFLKSFSAWMVNTR